MKKIFFALLLLAFTVQVNAQYVDDESEKKERKSGDSFFDKLYYGGNVGLQIGTNITYIEVSPLVGYALSDEASVGVGLSYIYVDFRNLGFNRNIDFNTSVYGGRVFGRYRFYDRFFAHSEIELLNMEYFSNVDQDFIREWVPGFYVGGGAYQNIDDRTGVNITVLVNLLYDQNRSIYASPLVIRIGFNF